MNIQYWQLCPKCDGEKIIPNIGIATSVMRTCPVCNGEGIVSVFTGLPPARPQKEITIQDVENHDR